MFRNVNLLDLFVGVKDEDGIADVDQLLNHHVLALADELQHEERSTWFVGSHGNGGIREPAASARSSTRPSSGRWGSAADPAPPCGRPCCVADAARVSWVVAWQTNG